MSELLVKLNKWGVSIEEIMERFLGDEQLYEECFHIFLNDKNMEQLKENIQTKNWEDAFLNAHTLKGIVANLGLKPLYEKVCVIVEALRYQNYLNLENEYQEMVELFNEIKVL